MPHQYCYLRDPAMVRLHFFSDLLIGIAYVAISVTLAYLVRRGRRDIPFHWMFLAFGAFIIACGGTHFMEVWTLWTPVYWLAGMVKSVTALASVTTALALPPLIPRALKLVHSARLSEDRQAELEAANAALQQEIAERRRAEEEIRQLAAQLEDRVRQRTAELARANQELAETAEIVQHSHDAILSCALDGTITSWNQAAERVWGYAPNEIMGKNLGILVPPDRTSKLPSLLHKLGTGREIQPFETTYLRKDGVVINTQIAVSPLRDAAGKLRGLSAIARDITDRKRQEEQLRQAQKLESLGLIAGGVAHDFNNLLVGILGNSSLAMDTIPETHDAYLLIQNVVAAGERAAHLTQQLLAYTGKGQFVSEKVDVSALVREISTLVQVSISKTVDLQLHLNVGLPPINADPGQLQQVVMNLVINAAESIGNQEGRVIVNTTTQDVDEAYSRLNFAAESLPAGLYVSLEVSDTGCGMNESVKARIFDPFFTTKFTGRGLGLSAVAGIVRSHGGAIRVYSEPGKGSTFKVLLPAAEGSPNSPQALETPEELRGSGLILVVDDEDTVRLAATAALTRYGYSVITADDGRAGVSLFQSRKHEITAVLLDMTMPVMGGTEAFAEMQSIREEVPVIVSSGYNEVEAVRRFTSHGIAAFIQKPYTAHKLARVVKRAIQERSRTGI